MITHICLKRIRWPREVGLRGVSGGLQPAVQTHAWWCMNPPVSCQRSLSATAALEPGPTDYQLHRLMNVQYTVVGRWSDRQTRVIIVNPHGTAAVRAHIHFVPISDSNLCSNIIFCTDWSFHCVCICRTEKGGEDLKNDEVCVYIHNGSSEHGAQDVKEIINFEIFCDILLLAITSTVHQVS